MGLPTSSHPVRPVQVLRQGLYAPIAPGIALATWTAGIAYVLALDDPRLRFAQMLGGLSLATVAWLWLTAIAGRGEEAGPEPRAGSAAPARSWWEPRTPALIFLAVALAARAYAISLPPAMSEDVFRHLYEGRVTWSMGPGFPFEHPPREAPALGVDPRLLDEAWLRVNHAEIPTIYPPFAQLVFALGSVGLASMKCWFVLFELAAIALVALATKSKRAAVFLLSSPLAVLEIAREGHADSLSMFGLALGAYGFLELRPKLGYAGFALAALAKLNGIIAVAVALRSTRRGAIAALLLLPLLAFPLLVAGTGGVTGLGAYASSWRAGDGLFSLVLAASDLLLGGDWRRIGDFTVTKHQLARALTGLGFLALSAYALRRPSGARDVPARAGLILLFLLLLTPTLHPWYVLWLLPFAALGGRGHGGAAIVALAALAPLLHHATWLELVTGMWTDVPAVRALVHVPVWTLLARDLARGRESV